MTAALATTLSEDAETVFYELADRTSDANALAVIIAALDREAWTGKAARDVIGSGVPFSGEDYARAERAAAKVSDPWAAWHDADDDTRAAVDVLREHLRANRPNPAADLPREGDTLDLDRPPAPPDWLVPDFLVRGKVHMVSGAVGVFKSGLWTAMMAANLRGEPFLGRESKPLRWMIVDGENSAEDITARWRALGLTAVELENVHITGRRHGVRLGEPEWDRWLEGAADAFRPDVLVLDTIARTCGGVDSNSQDAVADLFGRVLVPIVERHGLALLYTAHHRKTGGRGDSVVLGSVQWAGQAEQTITVAAAGPLERDPRDDGGTDTRRAFRLTWHKERSLRPGAQPSEPFTVTGRLDAAGALAELAVEGAPPSEAEQLEDRIVAAATAEPRIAARLAEAVGAKKDGRGFRGALARAEESGRLVKADDGTYRPA